MRSHSFQMIKNSFKTARNPSGTSMEAIHMLLRQQDLAPNLPIGFDIAFRLLKCKSREELAPLLREFSSSAGFPLFCYATHSLGKRMFDQRKVVTNYSPNWVEMYVKNSYEEIDPVVAACRIKMTPIVWDNEEHLTSEHHAFAREAISFGLRRGITFPVHTKHGDVGLLSLACDLDKGRFFTQLGHCISPGVLISLHAQEALSHISIASQHCVDLRLTHRELSVLQWVAQDKSTWEIAQILTLSEHGVTHHLRRVMNKLEVDSRYKAVSKAIALGLI